MLVPSRTGTRSTCLRAEAIERTDSLIADLSQLDPAARRVVRVARQRSVERSAPIVGAEASRPAEVRPALIVQGEHEGERLDNAARFVEPSEPAAVLLRRSEKLFRRRPAPVTGPRRRAPRQTSNSLRSAVGQRSSSTADSSPSASSLRPRTWGEVREKERMLGPPLEAPLPERVDGSRRGVGHDREAEVVCSADPGAGVRDDCNMDWRPVQDGKLNDGERSSPDEPAIGPNPGDGEIRTRTEVFVPGETPLGGLEERGTGSVHYELVPIVRLPESVDSRRRLDVVWCG